MSDRYQVVGECAHVNVTGLGGVQAVQLLYKGAFLPEGVKPERLKHLVDSGLVAKVEGEPIAPNAAIEQDPNTGETPSGSSPGQGDGSGGDGLNAGLSEEQRQAQRKAAADADAAEQKRAAARAKLPKDGSAPHANAGPEVWVEYAVAQGLDRGEAEKADKAELIAALKGK